MSTLSTKKGFYGWKALSGGMLVFFGMVGNSIISYGIFLPSMSQDLGWSRSAISGPYTAFWIVLGLLGPVAGISVSKFGPRKNIFFGNLLMAFGLLAMSQAQEIWHVYLFYSVLIGAGQAFGTFVAITTFINNWFTRRRSLAMGLANAFGGVGGLALSPLISILIMNLGWRTGWIYLSGIHLALPVIVAGLLIRNTPEEMGQLPEGQEADATQENGENRAPVSKIYQTPVDWKVKDAFRTPALWMVLIFTAAHLFTLNFLTLHQVAYLQDKGFLPIVAATTMGILSGMSIIGQLMCGALGTRFEGRYLATIYLAGFMIGVTILMNARIIPLVYLHTIISGISYGGLLVLMPVLVGAYFGRKNFARIIGWSTPFTAIFSAGSPFLAGFIYDTTGDYRLAFIIAIALLGIGFICSLLIRPPKPPVT